MTHLSPVRAVACPKCGAKVGKPCRIVQRAVRPEASHADRIAALEERNRQTGTIR